MCITSSRAKDEWDQCLLPYLKAVFPDADLCQKVADEIIVEGPPCLVLTIGSFLRVDTYMYV